MRGSIFTTTCGYCGRDVPPDSECSCPHKRTARWQIEQLQKELRTIRDEILAAFWIPQMVRWLNRRLAR